MKVALPEHQGRIAPVFDSCKRLMTYRITLEEQYLVSNEDWSTIQRYFRPSRLKELEVEVLLCGGISCWMEEQIVQHRIKLIPWLAGEVAEILRAFEQGRIGDPCYAMPGRSTCRRRLRGRRRPAAVHRRLIAKKGD